MEGKGSLFNIVLIVILAFLSLTVCILAGYVFFGGGGSKASPASPTTQTVKEIPKETDLLSKYVFGTEAEGEAKIFNLKKENTNSIPVIKVMIKLKYMKKVKGIKNTTEKLEAYSSEIKSMIGTYFMKMPLDEARDDKVKAESAEILKKNINELLLENEYTKAPIVYEVIFEEWFCQ